MRCSDYEEMDQLATARPFANAAYRVHRAKDTGRGVARAIRTAVSDRPGGVYLDIPAAVLGEIIEAEKAAASVWRVVDPAPRQAPGPGAVDRAIYLRAHAEPPLVVLGKGAAYAQADEPVREFIETTGVPHLPMSMAKGPLADDHPQSEATARSLELCRADVVMLVGARLNWLLGHGEAPQWSPDATFAQVDIFTTELGSNQAIAAPLVGDVACVMEVLLERRKPGRVTVARDWRDELAARSAQKVAKMAGRIEAAATAHQGDSAFGLSGIGLEPICRHNLPIVTVILHNSGVYRGDDVSPSADSAPAMLNGRHDLMIEAGFQATTPTEVAAALRKALASGGPGLVDCVVNPRTELRAATSRTSIPRASPSPDEPTGRNTSSKPSTYLARSCGAGESDSERDSGDGHRGGRPRGRRPSDRAGTTPGGHARDPAALGLRPPESVQVLADELNLSYADVHGVVTFHHGFRTESAGRTTDRVSQEVPHCPQYKVTAVRVTRAHAVTGEQRESAAGRSTTGQVVG